MNAKSKIILHMGVTLIVGIGIGAFLNRAIVQKRIRDVMERRAAGMFLPVRDILASATPEQEPKLRDALEKHRKSLADIHDKFGLEIQAAMEELKKDIDPLLSAEQKKRLETMLPGRPPFARWRNGPNFMGGPGGMPGGFRIGMLKEKLKLNDEQAARLEEIFARFRKQAPARFKEEMGREPGPQPGQEPGPGQGLGQGPSPFMGIDVSKMDAEIESVLTEEQKALFRKMREERPKRLFENQPPPDRMPIPE